VLAHRPFGRTGLTVSALGLGGGQIGEADITDDVAERVLHGALDLGVTLIDTAHGYGTSEERIGRFLHGRRDGFVLTTKGGAGVDGHPDWSPAALTATIEESLRRTRSERIDVFFLHSCPVAVLERGDLQDVLDEAVAAGKVGVAGYSGDNAALAFAADSGRFGAIETSINLVDQRNLHDVVRHHPELGIIAKRPIANAPWRFSERPVGHYAELYWERFGALDLDPGALDWSELALRFSAFAPGVDCAITGTADLDHLRRNVDAASLGALPPGVLAAIAAAWGRAGADWPAST
jgi:aryl-alcohol dehydrogenase-like predicted oxidoreductase